jgi:dolichol-phosphate mannosyltransferase
MVSESLSVCLPAFNEAGNIALATRRLVAALRELPLPAWEVLLIDDGSRDETGRIVDRLAADDPAHIRVAHHERNRGYGASLRTGLRLARYGFICYSDADNQFDFQQLQRLVDAASRADIVCGFRERRADHWLRRMGSWVFNRLVRWVFGLSVRDVNCAFKLFHRKVVERVRFDSNGFFVSAEVLIRARVCGFRIAQVGVSHYPRSAGRSTIRVGHAVAVLCDMARLWWVLRRDGWRARFADQDAGIG